MTVTLEDPGLWRATCDQCGEAVWLDTDPDDPEYKALRDARRLGWRIGREERVRFLASGGYTQCYTNHRCPDCA